MNQPLDPDAILALVAAHKWIALAALLIGLVVRLLKSDGPLPWTVPPRARIWLALGLGLVSGVLDKVAAGAAWTPALVGGLIAAAMAVLGHEGIIESLRGGKEIVPGTKGAGGPVAGLVLALLFNQGCAALGPILTTIEAGITDASSILGVISGLINSYFAGHPDPAAQAKASKALAATHLALDAAVRSLAGTTAASQSQIDAAFADFSKAYADLLALLQGLGIVHGGNLGAAPGAAPLPVLPTPLVVQRLAAVKAGAR